MNTVADIELGFFRSNSVLQFLFVLTELIVSNN